MLHHRVKQWTIRQKWVKNSYRHYPRESRRFGSMAMPLPTYRSTVSATQDQLDDLVLALLPQQGQWSQETYLWLSEQTNRLLEFTDGYVEVVPMPTDAHQTILAYLYQVFFAFLHAAGGKVLFAPLRLRIRERKFREPDILLMRHADD